jgi:hypothetical protein
MTRHEHDHGSCKGQPHLFPGRAGAGDRLGTKVGERGQLIGGLVLIAVGGITLGTAIGIPLTAIEPRITAAIFGGGFVVHKSLIEAARRVTVPIQFLLPWDDEHVDRQSALALFDAFASKEKTLHANPGDHRDVRWSGVDDSFLVRHLGRHVTGLMCR